MPKRRNKLQNKAPQQEIPNIVSMIFFGTVRISLLIFMLDYKRFVALLTFVVCVILILSVPTDGRAEMAIRLFEIAISCLKSTYITFGIVAFLLLIIAGLVFIIRVQAIFSGTSWKQICDRINQHKKGGRADD